MDTETAPRAGVREWIGLAALALPAMLVIMDMSVLHLALPTLSRDLEPSGAELLWITDVYGFVIAGAMITMGTLGDRIGRRRMLMIGALAFGFASVLAAYAPTAETLIVARALLGLAGAVLGPSTLSLISAMFHDAEQRSFAITVWMTSFMLGGAVGPLAYGVLLEAFWWGSVFLVAVPVMVFLLVAGPLVLPEVRNPDSRPTRPDQRRDVADRHSAGRPRREGVRQGGRHLAAAAVLGDRSRDRRPLRRAAAPASPTRCST